MELPDKIRRLEHLGAGEFSHINGTLLEHFLGTRDLLSQWQASEPLQDAGLFHAAYSTAGFGASLVGVAKRQAIAQVIGTQAENIVYHFCACDRENLYPALEQSSAPLFPDRFTGDCREISGDLRSDLYELTVANEVEIALGNPGFRAKHRASRFQIYSCMFDYLSEHARRAVQEVFG